MYFCKLVVCFNAASLQHEKYRSAEDKTAESKFQSIIIRNTVWSAWMVAVRKLSLKRSVSVFNCCA